MSDAPPAGWYPDPTGRPEDCYWNGSAWEPDRVRPSGEEPAAAEADGEPEEAGKLTVGDGISSPLYEFQASRFRGGRMFTPNVVRIWPDRIEEYEHHAVRHKNTRAINYAQVSQVTINKGLRWANIRVESTGGQDITLIGVPKASADQVKGVLDKRVHEVKVGPQPQQQPQPVNSSAVDVTDRLIKLGEMRTAGLITDEEFAIQKARLLE